MPVQSLDQKIPNLATKALFYELALSPKPGLVDRLNNGSHQDMDFYSFMDSALAFLPYFQAYYQLGRNIGMRGDLEELFYQVRQKGIQAEAAMFEATAGVNTHKGANFSFALFLGAVGYVVGREALYRWTPAATDQVFEVIQAMTQKVLLADFQGLEAKEDLSHGERLYLDHGIQGIRGEAMKGYPILRDHILPYLRREAAEDKLEPVFLQAKLLSMGHLEDGNLIHRGGLDRWREVQAQALDCLDQAHEGADIYALMEAFDQELIAENLSPGGSADILSLAYFLYFMEAGNF